MRCSVTGGTRRGTILWGLRLDTDVRGWNQRWRSAGQLCADIMNFVGCSDMPFFQHVDKAANVCTSLDAEWNRRQLVWIIGAQEGRGRRVDDQVTDFFWQ